VDTLSNLLDDVLVLREEASFQFGKNQFVSDGQFKTSPYAWLEFEPTDLAFVSNQ